MGILFFDSSALLKRYIVERGTERVLELVDGNDRITVSRLAHVEIVSVVVRRAKGGDIDEDHASEVISTLEEELRTRFSVTEVQSSTLTRAVDLVKSRGLKAADAIQLVCGLAAASGTNRDGFAFVCSDVALNMAAQEEGLRVLDPQEG